MNRQSSIEQIIEEIKRRVSIIQSEPQTMARELMIDNLSIDLEKYKQESYICTHTDIQCDDEVWDNDEHKKDRSCNHTNCREVCPECIPYIGYISEDCEAVKNWDSFVEQKNNELEVEKLAEEVYGKGVNHDYEEGFIDGYNKAKETLYTKQDLIDLVQGLKDYTKESHTILGHDDREAIEFVDIFLDYSNYQDNE